MTPPPESLRERLLGAADDMDSTAEFWVAPLLREAAEALASTAAPAARAWQRGECRTDREALLYLMQQFDAETWQCPRCGHGEDTATMDSADFLRRFLAAPSAHGGEVVRDRESDRARFADAAFNRWLDDGISDAGHTVYDAVGDVQAAWQGWSARGTYGDSPSYDALLIIAQSVCGALERAGITDCDDPGEAIDVLREQYERRLASATSPAPQQARAEVVESSCGPLCRPDSPCRQERASPQPPAAAVDPVEADNAKAADAAALAMIGRGYAWDGDRWYLPKPAAQEGDDEAARRYIRDWCPDHVKDYIDRLAQPVGEVDEATMKRAMEAFWQSVAASGCAPPSWPFARDTLTPRWVRAALTAARLPAGAGGVEPVGEVRIQDGSIVSTSIQRPLADGGYDVVPQSPATNDQVKP